jgi:hypothetical protein
MKKILKRYPLPSRTLLPLLYQLGVKLITQMDFGSRPQDIILPPPLPLSPSESKFRVNKRGLFRAWKYIGIQTLTHDHYGIKEQILSKSSL